MPDKLTWYAIISAFWLAFLAIIGVNIIGSQIMPETQTVETFGYPVEVPEEAPGVSAVAADTRPNIIPMIAAASLEDGQAGFRKCVACHALTADAKPLTGPHLHNIVGRPLGAAPFKYSESLLAVGGEWTYEKLDDYLENPKRLAPRGIMSFAGLKRADERAATIKFLMANTENAPPLPEVPVEAPAEAEAEAAPAEAAPAPAN
jgi:cytochrome c